MKKIVLVGFASLAMACGSSTGGGDAVGGDTGPTGDSAVGDTRGGDTNAPRDTGFSIDTAPADDTGSTTTDTGTTKDSGKADTGSAADTAVADTGAATDSAPVDTGTVADTGTVDTAVDDTATAADTAVADTGTIDTAVTDTADGGATENTVGLTCATDTDCDPLGTLANRCTNDSFSTGTLYPTPVCIGTSCDPGTGTTIVGCDNNRGVCLATATSGICLPACGFDNTGAAPTGCQGKDTCNVYGWGTPAGGTLTGVGYCFAGCKADTDCTGTDKCQLETGLCVKAPVTFAKAVGSACVKADSGVAAGCNCLYATSSGTGYCTQFCTVGDTTCSVGFACSAFLPKTDATGAPLFTTTPTGIAGTCAKTCTVDTDCTNSTCKDTTDGKVCAPF